MNRLHVLCLTAGCAIAAFSLAGCRGGAGSLPAVGGIPGDAFDAAPAGPKSPMRAMPFGRVGKSNTVTADMPVPRPDTKPCTVRLFSHYVFKNFNNKTFSYNPPAQCQGPWAKVVFNFDVRVTKGVQFDRTGIIWVDGGVVYFGTTAEPSPNLGPHWHVERDVTDLSALFTQASQGQIELWNCYCPPNYNGYQIGSAYVQFYPPDAKYPAPRVADQVIGIPYSPPLGGVATLPQTPMQIATTFPTNIVHADLDLYLQSQNREEQWFMCVPNDVWRHSKDALGFCRNTAFREGIVSVDGKPAGLAPIYPWIYTGGMDPYLWFPIPGLQALEFTPFRVDLTPFAASLSNGSPHTIDVRVVRAFNYFSGAGDLLLYTDPKQTQVTGALTEDTLPSTIQPNVSNTIQYMGGTGLFGGQTAQGSVSTSSHTDYAIAGWVKTSSGKVTTRVTGRARFTNDQTFNYTPSSYVQRAEQRTHFDTISTTSKGGRETAVDQQFDFPLSVAYPILPTGSGWKLPIKVSQGYRAASQDYSGHGNTTQLDNTVESKDTMIFDKSFNWIGVKNGASSQLYTFSSSVPSICYSKQIKSKNNVVTSITKPGC